MELGQKLSICRGQRARHLSLGLPHSFYFYLFQSFFFFPAPTIYLSFFLLLARCVSVIETISAPPFLVCTSLYELCSLSFLYRSASWYSLSGFVCSPHPNSLPRISLASFHAFSYIIPVSTSLWFSIPLSRFPSVLSSLSFYALLHHLPLQRYVLVYLLSNQQDRIKALMYFLSMWCQYDSNGNFWR